MEAPSKVLSAFHPVELTLQLGLFDAKRCPQSKLLPRRQSRLQQDHFPIAACRPQQPHKAGVPSSRLTLETGPGKPGGDQGLCCLLDLLLFQNSSLFDFTGKSEAPPRRPTSPQSTLRLLSLPSIFTSLQPSQRAKLKFPSLERHWQPPAVGFCFQFQAVRLLFASKFAAKSPLTPGTEKATNQLSFSGLGPRQHQSKDFAFGGGHGLRTGAAVTCQSLDLRLQREILHLLAMPSPGPEDLREISTLHSHQQMG
mmetsp:Transcript_27008/g.59003  ORF Transcript_27008/g.59003 Transcript_27008/m.59003 type:complete len:254 (-) Transcript_27008:250-1011(-)